MRRIAFPVLSLALCAATLFVVGATSGSSGPASAPPAAVPDDGSRLDAVSEHVFRLTNEERTAAGLSPLASDDGLMEVACRHSRDMIRRNFFAHNNPDGETPFDRAAQTHRRLIGASGENIWGQDGDSGQGPAQQAAGIVDAWMNSPGHRANILRSSFTHLGVCVVAEGDVIRATQSFADARGFFDRSLPTNAAPVDSLPVSITSYPSSAAGPASYDWLTIPEETAVAPIDHPTVPGVKYDGALLTPRTPGRYQIRFYFPTGPTRYSVVKGPRLTVGTGTTAP